MIYDQKDVAKILDEIENLPRHIFRYPCCCEYQQKHCDHVPTLFVDVDTLKTKIKEIKEKL